MNLLSEVLKPDLLLNGTIAKDANSTSKYIDFGDARRILFVIGLLCSSGVKAEEEITVGCYEAKTAAGGEAQKIITDFKVTGLVDSNIVKTDLDGIQATDTVEVNGVKFACVASAASAAAKTFTDADGLIACIKLHLPYLTASKSGTVVTIEPVKIGGPVISLVETVVNQADTKWVPAGITTQAQALVEIYAPQLSPGYSYLGVKIANAATQTITASIVAIRGNAIHAPVYQAVAGVGRV